MPRQPGWTSRRGVQFQPFLPAHADAKQAKQAKQRRLKPGARRGDADGVEHRPVVLADGVGGQIELQGGDLTANVSQKGVAVRSRVALVGVGVGVAGNGRLDVVDHRLGVVAPVCDNCCICPATAVAFERPFSSVGQAAACGPQGPEARAAGGLPGGLVEGSPLTGADRMTGTKIA